MVRTACVGMSGRGYPHATARRRPRAMGPWRQWLAQTAISCLQGCIDCYQLQLQAGEALPLVHSRCHISRGSGPEWTRSVWINLPRPPFPSPRWAPSALTRSTGCCPTTRWRSRTTPGRPGTTTCSGREEGPGGRGWRRRPLMLQVAVLSPCTRRPRRSLAGLALAARNATVPLPQSACWRCSLNLTRGSYVLGQLRRTRNRS